MQKKKPIGASKAEDPSGGGKTNCKDIPPQSKTAPSNKKEAPPAGLSTIGLNSGIYINEILKALTTYCQNHDMERIVESLTTGVSEKTATVVIDNDKLDIAEDPHGLYKDFIRSEIKQAASDQRDYIKSKAKLLGTIKSMTSKELEDKIATRFIQLQSELDDKLARTIKAAYTLSNVIDHQCLLQTWQALVTLLTTRQSGNKRLDLNAAMNASASLRQRNNETLFDYLQRFEGTLAYFNLVDPTYTRKEPIQAIKFLTSLDPTTYSTLLVDLQNEVNWGRGLYPNDLAGAMSLRTRKKRPSTLSLELSLSPPAKENRRTLKRSLKKNRKRRPGTPLHAPTA